MKIKVRYVLDSNVLVSAALFQHGKPALAVQAALDEGEILVSEEIVRELNDVLSREKFARYISEEDRARFLESLLGEARLIVIDEPINACRDPKDNKYLEAAVSGDAVCIVSGDEDLLVLHPFRGIPILRPHEFLDWLRS